MQIDIDNKKRNSTAPYILTLLAVVLVIGLPIYGYIKLKPDTVVDDEKKEEIIENDTEEIEQEIVPEDIEPTTGETYVEELAQIEGQWAYIISPSNINPENLPILVIYNHGSTTFVEEILDKEFKTDLIKYGEALTVHNYIFAVSNAHGVNWGNLDSINDNYNMYEYIKEMYGIQEKIYEIGFSMGGLPTLNFATTYPQLVSKIALLAPTTRSSEWDQARVDKIEDIDIKIWHGNADINVGYIYTQGFVNKIEGFGKDIDLVTLDGKTHWDVDTEYIDEIVRFFNES